MVNFRTQSTWTTGAWKFTPEGWPLPIKEQELPKNNVQVTDAHGTTTTLTRVLARKGGKVLGIHKATTLGKTAEYQYLKIKATTYIQAMNAYPLPIHKAWLCYLTVYCPSITYSLSTPSMSKNCIWLKVLRWHRIHPLPGISTQSKGYRSNAICESSNKNWERIYYHGKMSANVCWNKYCSTRTRLGTTTSGKQVA
eukprot:11049630-Ditylum_brightwellii.AAC.1